MKAVVYEKYGPPEVLEFREIEKPAPKDNEVLIKVWMTTVTVADSRIRGFTVPLSYWVPARLALGVRKPKNTILGAELAGEVEATGKDVKRFKPGDLVFGSTFEHGFGAYVEYKCMPEDGLLAIKPDNVSCEEAVTIPIGGRTALYFMRAANIQRGQKLLIYGASGSVGTYAVQLARHFGAEVTGVCSSANLELVQSLGADWVIDYTQEDFSKSGERYDILFDAVGKAAYADSIRSLKKDGTYLQAVSAPGISMRMRWTSMTSGIKTVGGGPAPACEDLIFLSELIGAGTIKPVIDRIYPLEQIVEAHRYVDKGHKKGNVVITVESKDKT